MAGIAGGFNPNFRSTAIGSRSGFNIDLVGLSQLTKKLEARIRRLEQSVLRKACQEFAEPIRADAERRARALISPRVQIKTEVKIRGTTANVKIGPIGEFFYLFFFEYGYWIRKIKKGPKLTPVERQPTMRPAYDAHKEEGLKALERNMLDALSEQVGES